MLEKKIREVCGCLRTLKQAWELVPKNLWSDFDAQKKKIALELETDCMIKLALLFPLLPESRFPDEVSSAMGAVGISHVETERNEQPIAVCFNTHEGEGCWVYCETARTLRFKQGTEPIIANIWQF